MVGPESDPGQVHKGTTDTVNGHLLLLYDTNSRR